MRSKPRLAVAARLPDDFLFMTKFALGALLALIGIVACGGSTPPPAPQGPNAASVAVQTSDLPNGMVKCDPSGAINKYIQAEETTDPTTAKNTKSDWEEAQKNGATAASVALYADSTAQCALLRKTSTDNITATTHPLLVNFVLQFKDEKSAATGYKSPKKIFGFSAATLRDTPASAQSVTEGTKTGLGANSIVLSTSFQNQSYYLAVWQNKVFMVFLAILNMDATTSKKVATSENSRIK